MDYLSCLKHARMARRSYRVRLQLRVTSTPATRESTVCHWLRQFPVCDACARFGTGRGRASGTHDSHPKSGPLLRACFNPLCRQSRTFLEVDRKATHRWNSGPFHVVRRLPPNCGAVTASVKSRFSHVGSRCRLRRSWQFRGRFAIETRLQVCPVDLVSC